MDGSTNSRCIGRTVSRYWLIDVLDGAAALGEVASQAADEAQVGVGVDEDLDVEQLAEHRLGEDQDPLDEHDPAGLDLRECRPVRAWTVKS